MRQAIEDGKRVVAITADVREFYHRTSPDFLLDPLYLRAIDLESRFKPDEVRFTTALIQALHAWAARTPIHKSDPSVGLPVGLSAARLVANAALAEFDRLIIRELTPLYYGRYVDDILLVLEDTQRFKDPGAVWEFIRKRVGDALRVEISAGKLEVHFVRPYLANSQIVLTGEKQKVFLLQGNGGMALVGSIERQIRERASEWRALPDFPDSEIGLSEDVVLVCDEDGEEVDNLRRAEALSIRRAALAMRLRNVEAFDHDLLPDQWKDQREAFLRVAREHLLALPQLFDFASYVCRLFALAVACRDYDEADALLRRIDESVERIATDCVVKLAAAGNEDLPDVICRWRDHLGRALSESLASALGRDHLGDAVDLEELLKRLRTLVRGWHSPLINSAIALDWSKQFFVHDLARAPYRMLYF